MSMADIDKIRKAAEQDGVWSKWFEEMAKKAIIKRASKQWPLGNGSDRFNTAVQVVNDIEGGENIERDVTPRPDSIEQQKQTITNEGLGSALSKIIDGSLTRERLIQNRALTDDQLQWLDDSLPEDLK